MSTRKTPKAIGSHMDVLLGSVAAEPDPDPPASRSRSRRRREAPRSRKRLATYRLPDDLVRKVDAISRAEGSSRAGTVAAAIERYIAAWEAKASREVLKTYTSVLGSPAS